MRLLGDSDKVAAMINERRETIKLLLRSTRSMVHEVTCWSAPTRSSCARR